MTVKRGAEARVFSSVASCPGPNRQSFRSHKTGNSEHPRGEPDFIP